MVERGNSGKKEKKKGFNLEVVKTKVNSCKLVSTMAPTEFA